MKLVRNTTESGKCKFAIIDWAKGTVEYAQPGSQEEFFVIKLKDVNAYHSLIAYAEQAEKNGDKELADDVRDLANRSLNMTRKKPDNDPAFDYNKSLK